MKTQILIEPALVGREHEIEELTRHLDSAVQGKGTTVFISGEAGSGKTRLSREFLEAAKKKGVAVLAGWCLSDAAVPYFPFIEAFNAYSASLDEEEEPISFEQTGVQHGLGGATQIGAEEREITAWLSGRRPTEKLGKPESLSPQVWKDQAFAAVAETLHSISNQEPIVLFLEDIHWADSASLALLHYIARATTSERILVLATFRSEELTADVEGRPHPLTETLRSMRREDLYREIKLSNLNQDNISAIGKSMLGGNLQQKLTEKLTEDSQGNPLYVVEALRMLYEHDSLTQEHDQWRLSISELGIPAKIKDIILQRLNILARSQKRILDVASVIGEKFDVELLGAVLGQDSLDVLETLNTVAQSTSLVFCEEDFFRFDHAKSRDAIYEEIPLALKKGYHARIAERMESASKKGKLPYSDLAYHYAQAGNIEKAVKYSLTAGQDALARWSNEEAIKHFKYVLESVSKTPENAEKRRKAQEGLGDAYYANNLFKEATTTFENLSNNETGVVRVRALRKAMESTFQYMDMAHLIELVNEAEPYAAADRLENARVLLSKSRVYTFGQGMWKLGLEVQLAALRVFEEEYSLWDAAFALFGAGATHAVLGEGPQKGLAEALRSIALFEELGDFRFQMEAYYVAGLTFENCWLANEALGMHAKVIEIEAKMKMGDYQRLVYANAFSAWMYEWMGNWEEALSHSLEALELSKKTDNLIAPAIAYSNLSIEYVRLGDLKHAEEYFEKLMKLPPEVLLNPFVNGNLSKAFFFAGKGQWKGSNQCFKEIFEGLKAFPSPGLELMAKLGFAWALKRQGRVVEAKVQLEDVQRAMREVEERFAHVSLQASVMIRREATVGEEFEMRLDLVNISRNPGSLVKAEGVIPSDGFKVVAMPSWCSLQNGIVYMKTRQIGPFKVETVKLSLQAVKAGTFTLNPKAVYIDDLGETKTVNLDPKTITVQPAQTILHVIAGRVSSGFDELNDLLGGGIPENYSIILAAASSDERELLIKRFLETAAQADQTTLYLTTQEGNAKTLTETFPTNFSVFLCSPQAELVPEKLPNIYKLKGVDNLTEIDIALAKYFRTLDPSKGGPRIACVQIVSDVLLQHHAVTTRKWLGGLLANLKSRGFTTLAVIDPRMHPAEEVQAVLGLFDGEIRIAERESNKGMEKVLKILKLYNQDYREDELTLTKESLKYKS